MTKIIDFSNGVRQAPNAIVIAPNFKVQGNYLEIEYKSSPNHMFRINAGCQSATVTEDNVDQLINEASGVEGQAYPETVILSNDKTSANSDSPKLKEEAGNYYISVGMRAYPKENHKLVERTIKPENKYFKKNSGYPRGGWLWIHNGYSYDLTANDMTNILSVLNTAKAFFQSTKQ